MATKHVRVLLMPPGLTRLTQPAIGLLRRDTNPTTGASKAYRESQLFDGVGEGTDTLDFLADLSALKVITPEEVTLTRAIPPEDRPVPRSDSLLLHRLKTDDLPYALCLVLSSSQDKEHARGTLL